MPTGRIAALGLSTPERRISRYLLAGAIVVAATLLRLAADPLLHDQIPYFIYVASVVVATWFCGRGGGVFSAITAAFLGNYFFVEPRYQPIPHPEDWIAMGMFASVAFGLVWLVGRWKRAEQALRAQAADLAALHEQAERANRLKDEFLATFSHELRTPLNAILGWATMLASGHLDERRRPNAINVIVRNAEAQARLINDVLDVSRIISGRMRLSVRSVDLGSVVKAAVEAVRPAATAKNIEIGIEIDDRPVLSGDPDRLQQVAWNLLSNAVKFTPEHGRVHVRVGCAGSHMVFSVSDTGIGIEPGFLGHLFERFRQADGSTTRQHGGLGLGLAIVRHIVELHGGTVRADSPGPNRGATFTVTLPAGGPAIREAEPSAREPVQAADVLPAEAPPRLARIRVLIVDDEPDARQLVQAVLTGYGADVRSASSAREAIEVLRQWMPDVLLADIGMPGEDGYSLIRRVRTLPPREGGRIPAAALTAYAQREDRERALSAGFQEHVPKPVGPEELARVVATLASPTA